LFSGIIESVDEPAVAEEPAAGAPSLSQRVSQLEESVSRLRAEIDALAEALEGCTQPVRRAPTGE
jgi:uncharacterized protein YceH (UPF0502 family)